MRSSVEPDYVFMKNMIQNISLRLEGVPYLTAPRLKLIGSFIVGQGSVQAIQVISGFFLIRWLSIEQYAQYSVAFAFQSTAQMLIEFGFSGAIVALVGKRINDRNVIGNYIKAGQFYRNRFFFLIGTACLVLFPLFTAKHNWSMWVTIALLTCILSNLFFSGNASYYMPPLIIHKRFTSLYRIQTRNGSIRFLLIAVLYFTSVLNAWLAALTTSLLTIANGFAFKKKAGKYVQEPDKASLEVRKEMFQYIRPIMPGIIFAAFQGQIMIFIISIFGGAASIAEVGALSRVGQLYLIFITAGGTIVAPYIARQEKEGLFTKYAAILGVAISISVSLVLLAYLFPGLFLWIIGNKYSHLSGELILMLINAGFGFVNGIMWKMNASRKWVYNWMPMVSIPGILVIQTGCTLLMDLSTTADVLVFSLYTNLFVLFTRILVGVVGFRKDKIEI